MLKCTTEIAESIKVVNFDDLFFESIFCIVKQFLVETNYTRKILHLLGIR